MRGVMDGRPGRTMSVSVMQPGLETAFCPVLVGLNGLHGIHHSISTARRLTERPKREDIRDRLAESSIMDAGAATGLRSRTRGSLAAAL